MREPSPAEIEELEDAIGSYASGYPDMWPPQQEQRRRFIKLSRDIRTV